jgi:hypothetical protein
MRLDKMALWKTLRYERLKVENVLRVFRERFRTTSENRIPSKSYTYFDPVRLGPKQKRIMLLVTGMNCALRPIA